jgi:hypothetical protein
MAPMIRVGMWHCMCCIRDLYKIEDEEDLADVLRLGENAPMIFETLEDGIRWCLLDAIDDREIAARRFGEAAVRHALAVWPL